VVLRSHRPMDGIPVGAAWNEQKLYSCVLTP
jgi:hypothetical protein